MDQLDYKKKNDLECYQKILNGIIAINIGTVIIPPDDLLKWKGFIAAWVRFQKENKDDITMMIHQFGKGKGQKLFMPPTERSKQCFL